MSFEEFEDMLESVCEEVEGMTLKELDRSNKYKVKDGNDQQDGAGKSGYPQLLRAKALNDELNSEALRLSPDKSSPEDSVRRKVILVEESKIETDEVALKGQVTIKAGGSMTDEQLAGRQFIKDYFGNESVTGMKQEKLEREAAA